MSGKVETSPGESTVFDWITEAWGSWFALLPLVLVGVVVWTIIVTIGWGVRALWRRIGRGHSGD